MAQDTIIVEGDLEALCREVESGLACRKVLSILWAFAEWTGPGVSAGGSSYTAADPLFHDLED